MPENEKKFGQKYFHAKGRSTEVIVPEAVQLSEGTFGKVYQATVEIKGKKLNMVIKDFSANAHRAENSLEDGRWWAKKAIKNYENAKKAGLKVFTTYRLSEDGAKVLMTNGNDEKNICVGTNKGGSLMEDFGQKKLEKIEDSLDFIDGMFKQAVRAGLKGIVVNSDSYFYLINRANPAQLDFVIGDMDVVRKKELKYAWEKYDFVYDNLHHSKASLEKFIKRNVVDSEEKDEYLLQVLDMFEHYMAETEYQNKKEQEGLKETKNTAE